MPKGAKYGGGSRKGCQNKTTGRAKEIILAAIDSHSEHFSDVMTFLKDESPAEYAKIMVSLLKFVMPVKTDVTSNGNEISIAPSINIVLPDGTDLII